MLDEHPSESPSSEEVSLALRRCWQPVARLRGPRARTPARRPPRRGARRLPHRERRAGRGRRPLRPPWRLALDGQGPRRVDPVPLPRLGVGGRDGACTRIPSLADQARSRRAPGSRHTRPRAVGPRLDGAGGAAGRPARPAVVRRGRVDVGSRHPLRAAGRLRVDDRELPRRRPLRLRPPGHPGARCRR